MSDDKTCEPSEFALVRMKASETRLKFTVHESGEVTETVNESRVNPAVENLLMDKVFGIRQSG